jgi:hypothetical protein
MDTTVKSPTAGRIIYYFHNDSDDVASANNAEFVPAMVIQAWGSLLVNVHVFPMNADAPNVLRYSVQHKSTAPEGVPYWDWPEIK